MNSMLDCSLESATAVTHISSSSTSEALLNLEMGNMDIYAAQFESAGGLPSAIAPESTSVCALDSTGIAGEDNGSSAQEFECGDSGFTFSSNTSQLEDYQIGQLMASALTGQTSLCAADNTVCSLSQSILLPSEFEVAQVLGDVSALSLRAALLPQQRPPIVARPGQSSASRAALDGDAADEPDSASRTEWSSTDCSLADHECVEYDDKSMEEEEHQHMGDTTERPGIATTEPALAHRWRLRTESEDPIAAQLHLSADFSFEADDVVEIHGDGDEEFEPDNYAECEDLDGPLEGDGMS